MIIRSKNNYTPDVLDCLANLSNDEVFTPPVVVNQMLDMLPQEVFESKDTTFLDPFTKSGVFLREITKRLLEHQIPDYKLIADQIEYITKEAIQQAVLDGRLDRDNMDEDEARKIGDAAIKAHPDANKFLNFEIDLQDALDYILKNQVFGIAITKLTAQLARRSLYCSKDASGRYSVVGTVFGVNSDGNIRFEPMKHTWNPSNQDGTARQGASCIYCGASAANLDRPNDLESHAYEFIHKDIDEIRKELENMEFTVVCGNPPYQLQVNEGGKGLGAIPIYDKFVEQAKRLNPKYLLMIIPSRWFSGGFGLNEFRDSMLNDTSIKVLHDYPNAGDVFPGVQIKAGVCYFLRDKDYSGDCAISVHNGDVVNGPVVRPLLDTSSSSYIRYNQAVSIIHKVCSKSFDKFSDLVSPQTPFGLYSTYKGELQKTKSSDLKIYISGNDKQYKGGSAWCPVDKVTNGKNLIAGHKVFIAKAGSGSDVFPHPILCKPFYGEPNSICNQSYLVIGPFSDKKTCENVMSYIETKFFRFMVLQKKNSQNAMRGVYDLVPIQDWSKSWTDDELYKKYGLAQDEIDFIESMIRPME